MPKILECNSTKFHQTGSFFFNIQTIFLSHFGFGVYLLTTLTIVFFFVFSLMNNSLHDPRTEILVS